MLILQSNTLWYHFQWLINYVFFCILEIYNQVICCAFFSRSCIFNNFFLIALAFHTTLGRNGGGGVAGNDDAPPGLLHWACALSPAPVCNWIIFAYLFWRTALNQWEWPPWDAWEVVPTPWSSPQPCNPIHFYMVCFYSHLILNISSFPHKLLFINWEMQFPNHKGQASVIDFYF